MQVGVAGLDDLQRLGQSLVLLAEAELVDHLAGQEVAVAGGLDLHLAQHLAEDDLDVLVVDGLTFWLR